MAHSRAVALLAVLLAVCALGAHAHEEVIVPCFAGYMCDGSTVDVAGSPELCPEGRYCPQGTTKAAGGLPCPRGQFCVEGSVVGVECPAGFYCEGSNTGLTNTTSNPALECPPGTWSEKGAYSVYQCEYSEARIAELWGPIFNRPDYVSSTPVGGPMTITTPPLSVLSVRLDFDQIMKGWRGSALVPMLYHQVYELQFVDTLGQRYSLPFEFTSHATASEVELGVHEFRLLSETSAFVPELTLHYNLRHAIYPQSVEWIVAHEEQFVQKVVALEPAVTTFTGEAQTEHAFYAALSPAQTSEVSLPFNRPTSNVLIDYVLTPGQGRLYPYNANAIPIDSTVTRVERYSYLPHIMHCQDLGSRIQMWQLMENSKCDIEFPSDTEPLDPWVWGGVSGRGDACDFVTQCQFADNGERGVTNKRQWFEAENGHELFHLSRHSETEFFAHFNDETLVPVTIKRVDDHRIQYPELMLRPSTVTLEIGYFQKTKTEKQIVHANLVLEGPWKEVAVEHMAEDMAHMTYDFRFKMHAVDWEDVFNDYAFNYDVYLGAYGILALISIVTMTIWCLIMSWCSRVPKGQRTGLQPAYFAAIAAPQWVGTLLGLIPCILAAFAAYMFIDRDWIGMGVHYETPYGALRGDYRVSNDALTLTMLKSWVPGRLGLVLFGLGFYILKETMPYMTAHPERSVPPPRQPGGIIMDVSAFLLLVLWCVLMLALVSPAIYMIVFGVYVLAKTLRWMLPKGGDAVTSSSDNVVTANSRVSNQFVVIAGMVVLTIVLWVEASYVNRFREDIFGFVFFIKIFQFFFDLVINRALNNRLIASTLSMAMKLVHFVILMADSHFTRWMGALFLSLILDNMYEVYLGTGKFVWRRRLHMRLIRWRLALKSRYPWLMSLFPLDETPPAEYLAQEKMVDVMLAHSQNVGSMLVLPVFLGFLVLFDDELDLVTQYRTTSLDFTHFLSLSALFAVTKTINGAFMVSIHDNRHGIDVVAYAKEKAQKYRARRTIAAVDDAGLVDSSLNAAHRSIDQVGFQTQYYTMMVLVVMSLMFFAYGIELQFVHEYNVFRDPWAYYIFAKTWTFAFFAHWALQKLMRVFNGWNQRSLAGAPAVSNASDGAQGNGADAEQGNIYAGSGIEMSSNLHDSGGFGQLDDDFSDVSSTHDSDRSDTAGEPAGSTQAEREAAMWEQQAEQA